MDNGATLKLTELQARKQIAAQGFEPEYVIAWSSVKLCRQSVTGRMVQFSGWSTKEFVKNRDLPEHLQIKHGPVPDTPGPPIPPPPSSPLPLTTGDFQPIAD